MKPIQIMMDEQLLTELDADEEVRKSGRSAVIRKIVAEYIDYRHRKTVASQYRRAYGEAGAGLGIEFAGWENEGIWPKE
jgi:metal-responsive CopG/Arc/MetJ family transcriptional regulator